MSLRLIDAKTVNEASQLGWKAFLGRWKGGMERGVEGKKEYYRGGRGWKWKLEGSREKGEGEMVPLYIQPAKVRPYESCFGSDDSV